MPLFSSPVNFVFFTPQTRDGPRPVYETLGTLRDRVRAELRFKLDSKLQVLTGLPGAHMSWAPKKYAKLVVIRYGYKLVGWPTSIPFVNLSSLAGGVLPLLKLRSAWDAGSLRFEPAARDDLARAAYDPDSILPHPRSSPSHAVVSTAHDSLSRSPKPDTMAVAPLVLHPRTLFPLGIHPPSGTGSSSADGTARPPKRPRSQRRDVKKPRHRPITNPYNQPLRRPKRGVTSARYVLEDESDIEDADGAFDDGEPAQKRARYTLTDDPIEEFVEETCRAG
ncbi:hypothetical protein BV20DRAFT_974382 [Pilatotrama ljubarskyi]|nr:hypothetical protein BV20DRAFT_975841 [Pilatotrama ljubarskyi]KAI0364533.1 hypothetical protein BV20DRAFT_974382 [Pilatotrama ljubarskyi]